MKNIKNFQSFNEKLSQDDLNTLLDKIGISGYNSLTDKEKRLLKNHSNGIEEEVLSKEDIIVEINDIIDVKYEGAVSISELTTDSSPLYKEENKEIHLIEYFMEDIATVEIYGGSKYNTHINSYDISYEELELNTLIEIRDLIKKDT